MRLYRTFSKSDLQKSEWFSEMVEVFKLIPPHHDLKNTFTVKKKKNFDKQHLL